MTLDSTYFCYLCFTKRGKEAHFLPATSTRRLFRCWSLFVCFQHSMIHLQMLLASSDSFWKKQPPSPAMEAGTSISSSKAAFGHQPVAWYVLLSNVNKNSPPKMQGWQCPDVPHLSFLVLILRRSYRWYLSLITIISKPDTCTQFFYHR